MDDAAEALARGQELLAQRQPAKALAVFDALLQINPDDIEARLGRVAALSIWASHSSPWPPVTRRWQPSQRTLRRCA